jgi:hypothetical protein
VKGNEGKRRLGQRPSLLCRFDGQAEDPRFRKSDTNHRRNYFHRNISPLIEGFKDNRRYGYTEAVAGVLGTAGDKSDSNRRRLSELSLEVGGRVSNKRLILVRTRIIRGDSQFDSVSCIYDVDRLGSDLSIATIAT